MGRGLESLPAHSGYAVLGHGVPLSIVVDNPGRVNIVVKVKSFQGEGHFQ